MIRIYNQWFPIIYIIKYDQYIICLIFDIIYYFKLVKDHLKISYQAMIN